MLTSSMDAFKSMPINTAHTQFKHQSENTKKTLYWKTQDQITTSTYDAVGFVDVPSDQFSLFFYLTSFDCC